MYICYQVTSFHNSLIYFNKPEFFHQVVHLFSYALNLVAFQNSSLEIKKEREDVNILQIDRTCSVKHPLVLGSRDDVVVRALASHQCGLGSNPGPGVISGLSLMLVLVLALRVFLWVLRFSSLHKNKHF